MRFFCSNFPELHPDCLHIILEPYYPSRAFNALKVGMLHSGVHVWSMTHNATTELGHGQNVKCCEIPIFRMFRAFRLKMGSADWIPIFPLTMNFQSRLGSETSHGHSRSYGLGFAVIKITHNGQFLLRVTSVMNSAQTFGLVKVTFNANWQSLKFQ